MNIEFSSIVTFNNVGFTPVARLRYGLFRAWGDGKVEAVGVWSLTRVDQNTSKVTESFDFTFCEPIECKSSCSTYFVKVTPIEIANAQVTVGNGRIAALAGGIMLGSIKSNKKQPQEQAYCYVLEAFHIALG